MRRLAFLKRPKVFIPLIVVILLVAAIVSAIRNLNGPAVGTISQTPNSQSEAIEPYASPGKYNGKYLSFTYPAHYKPISAPKSSSYLEVANFYATDHSGKQISVGLVKENINNDSGIAYRKAHPEIYRQNTGGPAGAIVFSKLSGGESTAFMAHGNEVVSISVTAPGDASLTADSQTVLNTVVFK